jgi:hypothetical protein
MIQGLRDTLYNEYIVDRIKISARVIYVYIGIS